MKIYLSESIKGTKAGMFKRLEDYTWGSYRSDLGLSEDYHQGISKLNKTSVYYVFVG